MRRRIIFYNPALKEKARELRNDSTKSEIILWKYLKGNQMLGYDFHRQKPLDNYIVDFFCCELSLAIEIDGDSHDKKQLYDIRRQKRLESLGINFLRFFDMDVKTNIEGVLIVIEDWIKQNRYAE
jgi:very-short-patch-repair endonuclease